MHVQVLPVGDLLMLRFARLVPKRRLVGRGRELVDTVSV